MRRHRCSFSLRRFFRWLTSDNFGERTLMIRRTSLLSTALVSVLCVLPNGALAQDVAAPAEVAGGIGDIVVTARKTEENLQSTPVAVTALNTAALERAQVVDMTGLPPPAPSLVIATGAPPSSGFPYASMQIGRPAC